ncbi:MAG: hypothetical protein C4318_03200 [Acidimicrobiia bacterium]
MDEPKVRTHLTGDAFYITLNRPERKNALDLEATLLLLEALDKAETSEARAVILSGAGGCFCSGADLSEISCRPDSPWSSQEEALRKFGEAFEKVCSRIALLDIPVIAALEGPSLGGGATLALFSDFRIAAPTLRIGIPASRLGITLSNTVVERIVAVAGQQAAADFLLRSREYSAEEALRRRVVDELAESADDLWARVNSLVKDISQGSRHSVSIHKKTIGRILSWYTNA